MTESKRIKKANSLLREAISSVILKDVQHPKIANEWITVTRVSISANLQSARVYISVMPNSTSSAEETLEALEVSSGFIACRAAQKVVLRYFPTLSFYLDDLYSPQDHIERILMKIREKDSNGRESSSLSDSTQNEISD